MNSWPSWMQRLNIGLVLNEVNEEDIIHEVTEEEFDEDAITLVQPNITMSELVFGENV